MTITIHACPFCDHDDVEVDEIDKGIIAICCPECQTIGPHTDGEHSLEDAIAKWNVAGERIRQLKVRASIVTEQCQKVERELESMRFHREGDDRYAAAMESGENPFCP